MALRGLRISGLPALIRWRHRHDAAIAMYHDPAPDVFDRHLAYLGRRFRFTTLDVIVDALLSGDWSAVPERALAITIDDGHSGNHALLPVILEHGIRPTIFVCSGIVGTRRGFWFNEPVVDRQALKRCSNQERLESLRRATGFEPEREIFEQPPQALSREQIEEMAPFVDFEAHTRSHPILTQCGDEEAWAEVLGSRQDLEKMLARPCRHFAYPNGSHGEREVDIVRRAQFHSARTTLTGWNRRGEDPYRLRIVPTRDDADIDSLAVTMTGLPVWLRSRVAALRSRLR